LEAEAIFSVLGLCKTGKLELVSSEVLELEIEKNPLATRRDYAKSVLELIQWQVTLNENIELRANTFLSLGLQPFDALHLASAEEAKADYFCTCDDRFLKQARRIHDLEILLVTPLELIEELDI